MPRFRGPFRDGSGDCYRFSGYANGKSGETKAFGRSMRGPWRPAGLTLPQRSARREAIRGDFVSARRPVASRPRSGAKSPSRPASGRESRPPRARCLTPSRSPAPFGISGAGNCIFRPSGNIDSLDPRPALPTRGRGDNGATRRRPIREWHDSRSHRHVFT